MTNDILILTQNTATKENVQSALGKFWKNSDMSDVTLATADGCQQKAHKVILASSSPFFENLFQRIPHPNMLIYMKGVSKARLEMVLEFIYLSRVEVSQEDLNGFLDLGKELQITGLVEDVKTLPRENDENPTQMKPKSGEQPISPFDNRASDQNQGGVQPHLFEKPQGKNAEVVNLDESFSLLLQPEPSVGEKLLEEKCNQSKLAKNHVGNGNLYSHKRYAHDREPAYLLDDINREEGQMLGQHQNPETEGKQSDKGRNSNNVYRCEKCEMTFGSMPILYTHKKAEHGGSLFACNNCDYKATKAVNLERHKRTEHAEFGTMS